MALFCVVLEALPQRRQRPLSWQSYDDCDVSRCLARKLKIFGLHRIEMNRVPAPGWPLKVLAASILQSSKPTTMGLLESIGLEARSNIPWLD